MSSSWWLETRLRTLPRYKTVISSNETPSKPSVRIAEQSQRRHTIVGVCLSGD